MMAEATMQEPTRYHPRVQAGFMVKVLTDDRAVSAKAVDVSMAGLRLLGSFGHVRRVTISIPLPGGQSVITNATVKRRDSRGVALEFDQLDWDEMMLLARYLHPRIK